MQSRRATILKNGARWHLTSLSRYYGILYNLLLQIPTFRRHEKTNSVEKTRWRRTTAFVLRHLKHWAFKINKTNKTRQKFEGNANRHGVRNDGRLSCPAFNKNKMSRHPAFLFFFSADGLSHHLHQTLLHVHNWIFPPFWLQEKFSSGNAQSLEKRLRHFFFFFLKIKSFCATTNKKKALRMMAE